LLPLVLLGIAILLTVSGELLLKQGMNRNGVLEVSPDTLLPTVGRLLTNPFILAGFTFIFSGSIFWLGVISRVPLSYAYPMLSTSYILVVGASWLFLGEEITLLRMVGVVVIILGVSLVFRSGQ
jgi:multidrug transporter EmrE-like cation transporter